MYTWNGNVKHSQLAVGACLTRD